MVSQRMRLLAKIAGSTSGDAAALDVHPDHRTSNFDLCIDDESQIQAIDSGISAAVVAPFKARAMARTSRFGLNEQASAPTVETKQAQAMTLNLPK